MLPVMGSAIPAVVDAVPRPGASAAERLAASQESEGQVSIRTISRSQLRQDYVDALESRLEEKFAALGEPGITRPKDALRFTNNLEYTSLGRSSCVIACSATRASSARALRACLIIC